jgi:hypothetical protein
LARYRLVARQWRENQTIIPFEFHFPIHDIVRVDASTNECIIRASLQLIYRFEFLQWNSTDNQSRYYRVNELVLREATLQSLWLPDIYSVDEDRISFHIEHELARINSHGHMTWTRRGLFTIQSSIDLTYYPFDHHYLHIILHHRQKTFNLFYQSSSNSWMNTTNARRMATSTDFIETNFDMNNQTQVSTDILMNQLILSRGWFVRLLRIDAKVNNENLNNLTLLIDIQRRREPHIYTTILPSLFLSMFVFIFYFSSIETHQRLLMTLTHILATILFINYVDRRISAEQLSYSPILIKYLSMLFLIEILSLLFDHFIHAIYYGSIDFIVSWLDNRTDDDENSSARLSRITSLTSDMHDEHIDRQDADTFLKQFIEREQTTNMHVHQQQQWHKHARLGECLCCGFFFGLIVLGFTSMMFILPQLSSIQQTQQALFRMS